MRNARILTMMQFTKNYLKSRQSDSYFQANFIQPIGGIKNEKKTQKKHQLKNEGDMVFQNSNLEEPLKIDTEISSHFFESVIDEGQIRAL